MSIDPNVAGQVVRRVLAEQARLAVDPTQLADDEDLYRVGLTSHATVTVMLELEDHFEVEFPPSMLTGDTFRSVGSICRALQDVGGPAAPGS